MFKELFESFDKYMARDIISKYVNNSEFNNSVIMDYINDRDFWMDMSKSEFETYVKKNIKAIEAQLGDI